MQRELPELNKRKLGLAAISYDSPEILREFAARKAITYPLLSDAGSKTIRAYGILNPTPRPDSFGYGIPFPGTLVLDHSGKIVAKYAEADFRERITISAILDHQFGGLTPALTARVEAKRLSLSLGASSPIVASGQRITLSIEATLPPGMHVYAPGVTGYKPVDWEMENSPAFKALGPEFPKPEMLRLDVIQQTVPVYRTKFRLRRDISVADQKSVQPVLDKTNHFNVKGTLRYQACDDKECYAPESVPVDWKLLWEPFDATRSSESFRHK